MPKGKRVRSSSKTIICHVYSYFEKQSTKSKSTVPPKLCKKTADATGLFERTVNRVVAEKRELEGSCFPSPSKRYKKTRERVIVHDFDTDAIRCTVHQFYEKEYPTLDKLVHVLKEKELFEGGRISLWKLLRKMGFRYKKVNDKRYVYEQPRIIYQRHQFLRRMRRNRREGRPVVYTDETWANAHDGREKTWVEHDDVTGGTKGGIRKPTGKGSRLIILHAGGENGWIEGADLVFQSKKSTGDYHDEMNSERYEEWFHDQLLPNVQPNSLIVIDNASYHSRRIEKVPNTSSRKSEMQDWLVAHNIEFPERALKQELLSLIRLSNPQPKYVIDELARTSGHEVVRLPPYHCELNPIELCWSQVKGHIKENNSKFTLSFVKELTYEGFKKVGPEQWKRNISHVKNKVEDHYWIADNLQEEYIEEFVIHVGGEESDTSSDEGSGSDSEGSISSDGE